MVQFKYAAIDRQTLAEICMSAYNDNIHVSLI